MQKQNVFLAFFVFFTVQINGQYRLSGIITDDQNNTVSFASVLLKDSASDKTITYAISKADGSYSLQFTEGTSFLIEVNHLSYEKQLIPFSPESTKEIYTLNFILTPKVQELKEVTVQKPLTAAWQKGDTIKYSLRAFTTGNEEKLKDVLNKLPGIEVDENGTIKANGKKVDKLLVDGQEFFGDNHKVATENLSAEMLGGIDLINNYESFAAIKDIDNSNAIALNIRIKDEYKGKITGDISSTLAYKQRYNFHSNLFRFDKKANLSFIADVNNTGEQAITLQDYMNLNSGIKEELRNNDLSNPNLLNNLPGFLLSDQNVNDRESQFGALNFAFFPSGKVNINGFSILNRSNQTERIISDRRFLQESATINFTDSINSKGNLLFNQTKINMEFKPNENNLLNYTFLLEPNSDEQQRNINSIQQNQTSLFSENVDGKNFTLGQQISYISRIAGNKLITFNLYQDYIEIDNTYLINSNQQLFNTEFSSLNQFKQLRTHEYGLFAKYTHKVQKNIFRGKLGYVTKTEDFLVNISQLADETTNVSFDQVFFTSEFSVSKNKGFFQYLLQTDLRNYSLNFENLKTNNWFLLPKIQLKLEFTSTQDLLVFYSKNIGFASASRLNNNIFIENYRSIYAGSTAVFDRDLFEENLGLRYLYFSLYSGTVILLSSSFSETSNFISTNSLNTASFNITSYQNTPRQQQWLNNISFETRINPLKSKLKLNGQYNQIKSFNFLNNVENEVNNRIISSKIALVSYFKNALINYDFGFMYSSYRTVFETINTTNENNIYTPYINLEGNISKKITYNFGNNYEIFRTQNNERTIWNMSFKLRYKKEKSPLRYWVEGVNILNLTNPEVIEVLTTTNIFERNILSRIAGFIGFGISYDF